MSVKEIEAAITQLSAEDLAELAVWFADYHARLWDQQVEDGEQARVGTTLSDYQPFPVKKRVAGLGKGTVQMAPDFDDPLPDSFWLGEA